MKLKSFHISVQGASHIKKNKECQDASISYWDETCSIIVVCDGHGGDDYVRSAVGSVIATQVTKKNIRNFIDTISIDDMRKNHKNLLKNLEASIINDWNQEVYTHSQNNPFTEIELGYISEKCRNKIINGNIESAYGTTVIAVAVTKEYWFGIHIGDGKCVAINPEGKFSQPIPWDEKCFMNVTTSICDNAALNHFREFYSEKLPIAVFIASDGVDDCFINNEQLNNFYKTVLYSFASTSFEEACDELKDYLPRLSAKGSGDDMSVAAILNLDSIGEIEAVKSFDAEKEKIKIRENAKIKIEKSKEEKFGMGYQHNKQQESKIINEIKPKFCEQCGTKIMNQVKFCSECGQRVELIKVNVLEQKHVEVINIQNLKNDICNIVNSENNIGIMEQDTIEIMTHENIVSVKYDKQVDKIQADTIEKSKENNYQNIISETRREELVEVIEMLPKENRISLVNSNADKSKETDKNMSNV